MNREPAGWLEEVVARARTERWCTSPRCTTCGSFVFRRAFWVAAAHQAGISKSFEDAFRPHDVIDDVSAADLELLVRTLAEALRDLPTMSIGSSALRTIMIDLNAVWDRSGIPITLDATLEGTLAGRSLAMMRAHHKKDVARYERWKAENGPEAVAERERMQRVRRRQTAIAHTERQMRSRRWSEKRSEMLAVLARLSHVKRLTRLTTDPPLKLGAVPAELIPTQEQDLVGLEKAVALELIDQIGHRKGPWRPLRRMLLRLVAIDAGSS